MTQQTEPIWEHLQSWPDRWHYPKLALALSGLGEERGDHVDALLADLARPLPVEESARRLVRDGAFAVVDLLLAEDFLTPEQIAVISEDLRQGRAALEEWLDTQWKRLTERAERAAPGTGFPAKPEIGDVLGRPELQARVAEAEQHVARLEAERAAEILAALETAGGNGGTWESTVRRCVAAGEYEVAEQLLDAGPNSWTGENPLPGGNPLTVPRLTSVWPYGASYTPAELLDWCLRESPALAPGFEAWLPDKDDADALALAQAMADLDAELSRSTVAAFLSALHRLMGVADREFVVDADGGDGDGGFRARLCLCGPGLPRLPLAGPEGVTVWISPVAPPPDQDRVWLVVGPGAAVNEAARQSGSDAVRLDGVWLHRMLAVPPTADRPVLLRLNTLRTLCAKLPVERFLADVDGFAADPAWLLDLLNVPATRAVRDVLRFETDGNPLVTRLMLTRVMEARPAGDRTAEITLADIDRVRREQLWWETVAQRLLEPVKGDSLACALFWITCCFYAAPGQRPVRTEQFAEDATRLLAGADGFVPAEVTARCGGRLADFDQALVGLAEAGLVRGTADGAWAPRTRLIRGIVRARRARRPRDEAHDHLLRWFEELRADDERILPQARLSEVAVQMIGHSARNNKTLALRELAAVEERFGAAHFAALREEIEKLPDFEECYRQCLGPPRPVNVVDVLNRCIGQQLTGTVGAILTVPPVDPQPWACALVNEHALKLALGDLYRNAHRVITIDGRRRGRIETRVAPEQGGRYIRVEILDDGPGHYSESYRGTGRGIALVRRWIVGEYAGRLDFLPGQGLDGGMRVRVLLPRHTGA